MSNRAPGPVTEAEWLSLRERFREISAGYLRRLLRASGEPLAAMVEGVRQETLDELERTLLAIGAEYAEGDTRRRTTCRGLVIEAKDHARFAAVRAKDDAKRALKEEMVRWMLIWLEDPGAFPLWVKLRKRRLEIAGDSGEQA